MRKPLLIVLTAVPVLAFLGWRVAVEWKNPGAVLTTPAPTPGPPPDTTSTDGTTVFQKAFWRRPGDGDRILHAERREWLDSGGVSRWQWFIAAEPSPALVKYLREENAFGLTSANTTGGGGKAGFRPAPDWFPADPSGFDVLSGSAGSLKLLFSKTGNQLYASDSGGGFRPGASEPAESRSDSSSAAAIKGRLPNTPPPNPVAQ
ncbi:MAG: hypothetical protein V4726_00320 [Verrucomicrobiota bacterium]